MAGKSGWFKTGEEGVKEAKKFDEDAARRRAEAMDENVMAKKRRFWLPPDKSAVITLLDSPSFFFREHQLYIGGSWQNYETCLSDFDNCPLDEAGLKPSYVVACTIIDHTEFVLKRGPNAGTLIKDQKRLLVCKSTARLKLLKQKERREGDLTYCQFEATRYTAKECSTGEDFQYIKTLTLEEGKAFAPATLMGKSGQQELVDPAEWIKPFNYPEVFKPKSADELCALIGGVAPVGSEKADPINPADGSAPEIGRLL